MTTSPSIATRAQDTAAQCCQWMSNTASSTAHWASNTLSAGYTKISECMGRVAETVKPYFNRMAQSVSDNKKPIIIATAVLVSTLVVGAIFAAFFCKEPVAEVPSTAPVQQPETTTKPL